MWQFQRRDSFDDVTFSMAWLRSRSVLYSVRTKHHKDLKKIQNWKSTTSKFCVSLYVIIKYLFFINIWLTQVWQIIARFADPFGSLIQLRISDFAPNRGFKYQLSIYFMANVIEVHQNMSQILKTCLANLTPCLLCIKTDKTW